MTDLATLVATHALVATLAWCNGYLTGAFLQRRLRLEADAWDTLGPLPLLDLTDGYRPYDWAVDGECVGVAR